MSVLHDKALGPRYLTGLKHVPEIINIESVLRFIVTMCDSVLITSIILHVATALHNSDYK